MTDTTDPDEIFKAHAELIGRVTVEWNDLTQIIFWFFAQLSGMPNDRADAVFFVVKNDRTQRQMVKALARIVLAGHEQLKDDLIKELNAVDKLAETRNEATHSAWAMEIAWTENEQGETTSREPLRLVQLRSRDERFTERFEALRMSMQDTYARLDNLWKEVRKIGNAAA